MAGRYGRGERDGVVLEQVQKSRKPANPVKVADSLPLPTEFSISDAILLAKQITVHYPSDSGKLCSVPTERPAGSVGSWHCHQLRRTLKRRAKREVLNGYREPYPFSTGQPA